MCMQFMHGVHCTARGLRSHRGGALAHDVCSCARGGICCCGRHAAALAHRSAGVVSGWLRRRCTRVSNGMCSAGSPRASSLLRLAAPGPVPALHAPAACSSGSSGTDTSGVIEGGALAAVAGGSARGTMHVAVWPEARSAAPGQAAVSAASQEAAGCTTGECCCLAGGSRGDTVSDAVGV
jgi:hypothetical protein